MADEPKTMTDRIKAAADSPTAKRIIDAGRQFVTDPMNIQGAARAVSSRKKGKQGRSSSGQR
jgi:hypothetical protein